MWLTPHLGWIEEEESALSGARTKELENQVTFYAWWLPAKTETEETLFGVSRALLWSFLGSDCPCAVWGVQEGAKQLPCPGCTGWGGVALACMVPRLAPLLCFKGEGTSALRCYGAPTPASGAKSMSAVFCPARLILSNAFLLSF